MEDKLKFIKEVILNTAKKYDIEIDKIILFGSRARGDYKEDSDWDILIVTKERLDWKKRKAFWLEIVRSLPLHIDLIIVDRDLYETKAKYVGNVAYEAKIEGKVL